MKYRRTSTISVQDLFSLGYTIDDKIGDIVNDVIYLGERFSEKYSNPKGFLFKRYKKQEMIVKKLLFSRGPSWDEHRYLLFFESENYDWPADKSFYPALFIERGIIVPKEMVVLLDTCIFGATLSLMSPFLISDAV